MMRQAQTSLQVKLILAFIVVMLIPTMTISAYNLLRVHGVLLDRIKLEQLRLAEARAATAESSIAEGGADLLYLVQAPAMRRFARSEARALDEVATTFKDFLIQTLGRYSSLCLLETAGRELVCVRSNGAGFDRAPDDALVSRSDDPAFLDALRQAGIPDGKPIAITGAGLPGAPIDRLRYSILYPDELGNPAGVLVLEAPVAPLLSVLIDPSPNVNTHVVDSDGALLPDIDGKQHADHKPSRLLSDEWPNDAQIILRQSSGTIVDSADQPGVFRVFTRIQPPSQSVIHWKVIYEYPLRDLVGEVYAIQFVIIFVTAGALLIALALAQVLTAQIVRPLRALAAAAERIGADDLWAPIPAQSHDEVGALARTLDRTVTRLREALASAEERRNEAETLRAATQALGTTLDRTRVLELILSELRKVVPYDSASVQEINGDYAMIIASYGVSAGSTIAGLRFSLVDEGSPNALVARRREPVILEDGPARFTIFTTPPYNVDPIRSWLGVPLLFGDRLIGLITLDKYQPGFYTAEYARLAGAFGAQAAAAMENTRLYEAVHRELADRRRAEAAYARLAAIIEATSDIVGMADVQGRILFLNQAGRRTLRLPDDADLNDFSVFGFIPPQLHTWLRKEAVPAAMRQGTWAGETTIIARDGVEFPVSQVIVAHRGPDGRTEFLSTIIRDMRERRRAEEELRQAQKMEALGRLAGGMAHDFNNLLTVILGEADMMLDDAPQGTSLAISAEQIRQASMRASALTRQLLAFSRRQVLQPELIDLGTVVAGMEQMLRRLLGEDITLAITLAPTLPLVRADPGQIEQVLMNLCLNGRDAMPEGGRLLVETATVFLDEHYTRQHPEVIPGRYVSLEVSDTGAGMDEETRIHIFEPFFTTKARGKGTGLGLATVHGIVRQSGGHIWFYSEPGLGTSFKVYLPVAVGESPPAVIAPTAHIERAAVETVLLVEDDDDVRALARQILARQGFAVLEAGDGSAALALAKAYSGAIHLLLTDVVMPGGLNGVQLARALRGERPHVRIVYMSGYTDNALVAQSLYESEARYIQKPFTPVDLVRTLSEALT